MTLKNNNIICLTKHIILKLNTFSYVKIENSISVLMIWDVDLGYTGVLVSLLFGIGTSYLCLNGYVHYIQLNLTSYT